MKPIYLIMILLFASISLFATEYHVSVKGKDTNNGTAAAPFKTIGKAAGCAYPGDVITIYGGVYREWVNPPRGGGSESKPITYQAAKGEKVEIKGSEIIKGWKKLNDKTWMVKIPDTFFGGFNPYADTIYGDWLERGKWCHTGEVYIDDKALAETPKLENVLSNNSNKAYWFCRVENGATCIWANFNRDPNKATVEINVRQSVFYPDKPYVNYIHLRGLTMSHAATPWAPPTAEQIGLVGTHWSKGWVIENNIITHSKCVGITLGKYGDEWDNKSGTAEAFVKTTERALENNWNKEYVGSHTVRNNRISCCGQAGIVGSLGAIFSCIEGNTIFETGLNQSFWGYELAGIKFHAPVDVIIKNNHIYRTEGGIWLDWMSQGTRVTGNLLHDNKVQDLSLEVNHGPILVDNNFFLSKEQAQVKLSQGVVFINNLMACKIWPTPLVDDRETPYLIPHGTQIAGLHDCPCGNVAYYNNIFTRIDLTPYDACNFSVKMDGNIFLSEAVPAGKEANPYHDPGFDPGIEVIEKPDGWYLQINVSEKWSKNRERPILSAKELGKALIPGQSFDHAGGLPVVLDTDYLGHQRDNRYSYPGPVDFKGGGQQLIKVYSLF